MKCDRCGGEANAHTMSTFNTDDICMACKAEEEQHVDYELAREYEEAAVKRGDFNYPGVGWPGKGGRVWIAGDTVPPQRSSSY